MIKVKQKRTLATHANLLSAARGVIAKKGYGAMRVEEVVALAGVAKGTFFAHFRDKDALMELLIGDEINRHLDALENIQGPENVEEIVQSILPLVGFMTSERFVFDVILRHSGAAALETIGPIADTFERQVIVMMPWLQGSAFRKDIDPVLLAEGIQAFTTQSMALHFCAVNNVTSIEDRLIRYLEAWMLVPREA
jgi:AcrR family transcriptional regulator